MYTFDSFLWIPNFVCSIRIVWLYRDKHSNWVCRSVLITLNSASHWTDMLLQDGSNRLWNHFRAAMLWGTKIFKFILTTDKFGWMHVTHCNSKFWMVSRTLLDETKFASSWNKFRWFMKNVNKVLIVSIEMVELNILRFCSTHSLKYQTETLLSRSI